MVRTLRHWFPALLLQRCPRCRDGKVFSGLLRMRETCPVCGHRFEKEPGYFMGALYASYFLSIPLLALLTLALYWFVFPTWSPEWVVLLSAIPYVLLVPLVYRYSRIIWMYIDPPV